MSRSAGGEQTEWETQGEVLALRPPQRHAIEVSSIDPCDANRQAIEAALRRAPIVVDSFHLIHGANTLFGHVRRDRERLARSGKRPTDVRRAGTTNWRQDLCHRLPKARERLTERQRRQPREQFDHAPLIAEL